MPRDDSPSPPPGGAASLQRVVGVSGAVLLGLGSILGTGVFVSLGVAAGVAGEAVIVAVGLAAVLATCNGLSSAQLAASHPVSGGTYEYGYRYLTPSAGFVAGWAFLCAKSASAATAALGLAAYALGAAGWTHAGGRLAGGVLAVAVLTAIVAGGMRRSNRTNAVIVSVTLAALAGLVLAGLPAALRPAGASVEPPAPGWRALLEATALMFVAYTGYGRVATLGEEIRDPARNIPRAVIVTLAVTGLLYAAVAWVGVAVLGAPGLAEATARTAAPLEAVAQALAVPGLTGLVTAAAITAMLGVLLNLILGLSRVWLAMARRADMPPWLSAVDGGGSPRRAVWLTGAVIGALVCLGDVTLTWSISAFTVLVYYAITNGAALRLPAPARRFPRAIAVAGLAGCLSLAPWVDPQAAQAGVGLIVAGLAGRWLARAVQTRRQG